MTDGAPVPHQTRTGTCSKRRPRRDYVSPVEPVDGEHGTPDNPNGQPRMELNKSASLAQNRGVQIHPRPPSAATPAAGDRRGGKNPSPGMNGDMFQAPPRRDNVYPFDPEGSHGGCP